jgi:hypothetical protein
MVETQGPIESVSLDRIGGGAAVEMFGEEMKRVLENIADPNTEAEEKRTLLIKVVIQPNETRDMGLTTIQVSSKVAPTRPHGTLIYMGRERKGGPLVAIERNQRDVFDDDEIVDERTGEILPIRKGER